MVQVQAPSGAARPPVSNADVQIETSPAAPSSYAIAPTTGAAPVAAPGGTDPGQAAGNGQWAYTNDNGWMYVPQDVQTVTVNEQPYAYVYTPSVGWGWSVSPWGWGPFYYGPWAASWGPRFWGGYAYGPGAWGGGYGRGWGGGYGSGWSGGRGYGGGSGGSWGGHGGGSPATPSHGGVASGSGGGWTAHGGGRVSAAPSVGGSSVGHPTNHGSYAPHGWGGHNYSPGARHALPGYRGGGGAHLAAPPHYNYPSAGVSHYAGGGGGHFGGFSGGGGGHFGGGGGHGGGHR